MGWPGLGDEPRELGRLGHSVAAAATGEEGLRLASDAELDVVLLDLSLPDALMDRAARWLRETDAYWLERDKTWIFPSGDAPYTSNSRVETPRWSDVRRLTRSM